jgi:hypothetical protein
MPETRINMTHIFWGVHMPCGIEHPAESSSSLLGTSWKLLKLIKWRVIFHGISWVFLDFPASCWLPVRNGSPTGQLTECRCFVAPSCHASPCPGPGALANATASLRNRTAFIPGVSEKHHSGRESLYCMYNIYIYTQNITYVCVYIYIVVYIYVCVQCIYI